MASVLVYTNGKSDRVVKRNNIVYVAHGPTGPAGTAGGASRTTLLNITQYSPSGTSFFVNSGGTHYTFNLEAGNLGATETAFLENDVIQIYLRGTKLLKTKHIKWLSEYSFTLYMPIDTGDYLEILS